MTVVALEELQTRSRFIHTAALQRTVYAVEGAEGLAHVASPRIRGRDVELLWTDPIEAQRWADVLVTEPRVVSIPMDMLLARHLPKLAEQGRAIGMNWSDAPAEPEMTAQDLDAQLRRKLIELLVEQATKTRQVWVLKGGDTHATIVTRHPAGGEALPVFVDRASAERAMDGVWAQTLPVRVPIADFLQKTILWCVETRRRIAPAFMPGPGLIELHAWEAKASAGRPLACTSRSVAPTSARFDGGVVNGHTAC